ncbi:hypothetical protein VCV18_004891 [Metarhizium anisopliae]
MDAEGIPANIIQHRSSTQFLTEKWLRNSAIAYFELIKANPDTSALLHKDLINAAIADARGRLSSLQGSATFEEFVVEISVGRVVAIQVPTTKACVNPDRWSNCSSGLYNT